MALEFSAGAVIFRKENNKIYYLLLRYPTVRKKEYWGLAKGHIEKGEKIMDTVIREVAEETGITDINLIKGFKKQEKYIFTKNKRKVYKTVVFLLAETKTKKVQLSTEHLDYKWLEFEKAYRKLTYKNAQAILQNAHRFIYQQSI